MDVLSKKGAKPGDDEVVRRLLLEVAETAPNAVWAKEVVVLKRSLSRLPLFAEDPAARYSRRGYLTIEATLKRWLAEIAPPPPPE